MQIEAGLSPRRRGVESSDVFETAPRAELDITLIRLLDRVLRWAEKIRTGASITMLAREEGVSPTFITERIHVAMLSPRIVELIIEGRQSPSITSQSLILAKLPLGWRDQEARLLGRSLV